MNIYGGKRPRFDARDYQLAKKTLDFPEFYTITGLPQVKDQQDVSSCVAHAMSSILEFHGKNYNLSTNFIYGIQKQECKQYNKGMHLTDACKITSKYGDMLEEDCSGNDEIPVCYKKAEDALLNSEKAQRALSFKINSYYTCKNDDEIKYAIYHHGPVLGSIKLYNDFHLDENDVLYTNKKHPCGYHAVMIYGYTPEGFWCQNSWGEKWGKKGSFFVPSNLSVIAESKAIIDWLNDCDEELKKPKRNKVLDIWYKVINFFVNIYWTIRK